MQHSLGSGFTLVELLVTVSVFAIIAAIAVPSYQNTLDRRRLIGAAEQIQSDFQFARSEAVKINQNVFMAFRPVAGNSATWCYGLNAGATCNCTIVNSCQISGVNRVVSSNEFRGVSLAQGFAGGDVSLPPRFTGINNSTIMLTSDSGKIDAVVDSLGRIRLCSPTANEKIAGYSMC